jgi:hypothetical protein
VPSRGRAPEQGEHDSRVSVRQERRAWADEARAEVGDGGAGSGRGGGEVVAALLVLELVEKRGGRRWKGCERVT